MELGKIVLAGFVQVLLVSVNTYNIPHGLMVPAVFVGFLISLMWTVNVRSIAFGGWPERVIYSVSAAAGILVGMLIPHLYASLLVSIC